MERDKVDATRVYVISAFMILFLLCVIEAITTDTESALDHFILKYLPIPIIVLSIVMAGYWILMTDDFWNWYDGIDLRRMTRVKTIAKFLIWIPAMCLCFFLVSKGVLSFYNRSVGVQTPVTLTGQIIDKRIGTSSRGRITGYHFKIYAIDLGREVDIKVTTANYNDYNIGDSFQTKRKVGTLGYVYE